MQPLDPAGVYTNQEVIDALTGRYGSRSLTYRYDRLSDTGTLIEPIDWVSKASVGNNALADIKRWAKFTIVDRGGINYLRDRIKPWACLAMPDGGVVEWPQGVFLLSTPERQLDAGGVVTREVEAYDQLVVLRDDKATGRYSVTAGTLYTTAIVTLLDGIPGLIGYNIVPSALTLPTTREWDYGTPKVQVLNDLLGAINYGSAWFNEHGILICRPYQSPADRAIEYTYADGAASVRKPERAVQAFDLFDKPNRWTLVKSEADEDPIVATYTNSNPASPTSTVSRGRVITDFRTETEAADLTTLQAKVARLAFESSQVYETIVVDTLVMPFHSDADVVGVAIPGLAVDAKYSETSWSYDLAVGATMTHELRRVVTV